MRTITIRRAQAADAGMLHEALAALSRDLGDAHRAGPDDLLRHGFGERPSFSAVLAEQDGRAIGAAVFSPVFSTIRGGPGLYVSDLWVDSTIRGGGLGRRLLAAAAAEARRDWGAGFLRLAVYEDNARARAFYERLGFDAGKGEAVLTLEGDGLAALKGE
ncbi:MAG: N-acetyltransferase family protein [Flavobacteriaceae bacterium]